MLFFLTGPYLPPDKIAYTYTIALGTLFFTDIRVLSPAVYCEYRIYRLFVLFCASDIYCAWMHVEVHGWMSE